MCFLLILSPPRATRTATPCPYAPLFRSPAAGRRGRHPALRRAIRVGDHAGRARNLLRQLHQPLVRGPARPLAGTAHGTTADRRHRLRPPSPASAGVTHSADLLEAAGDAGE